MNVKSLKLAFAVPLGGTSGNEYNEATPVVEDGFMYVTDVWSVVYKIDVRSGTEGLIVWKMDPACRSPIATVVSRCGAISSSRLPAWTAG